MSRRDNTGIFAFQDNKITISDESVMIGLRLVPALGSPGAEHGISLREVGQSASAEQGEIDRKRESSGEVAVHGSGCTG